ncbi:TPA: hypothetical protein JG809_004834 [Vibrio parahaemolyticus]|uniref:hypothetical protein n=1 Tax=Vibrio parahaemolyticus TaxID=670 RepID=UPI00111F50A4|nr:hypothetical protein [Vibrio parahaemolyticus]EJA7342655.1 hypothetical protein [Vibrio parahaemolyticus]MBY3750932.1 hypothetical protein [Vibrio parahaemolyticus]MBY3762501.1 hypothetical protein [Vibrio parahaemolyticus]MBY3762706.1 hypothetical protein [Vibrio parahaemolyticus]MBY3772558.1 hypothetical protein [Vibrio parahaemolyticus]
MKDKLGLISVVSLLMTVLGVVAPIAWDYYSGQKNITLTALSRNMILSPSMDIDGLEINYKGTPLTTLNQTKFLVENTGSKSLRESDVVSPLKIKVDESVKILDAFVENKVPQNIEVDVQPYNSYVEISFSLLNPSDTVVLNILTNTNDVEFTATARIAGVSEIEYLNEPPKTLTMWAILWIPVCMFSAVLVLVSLYGITDFPQEFRIKRSLKSGNFEVPDFTSYEEAEAWVKSTISFALTKDIEVVLRLISRWEGEGKDIDLKELVDEIALAVKRSPNNLVMALFVGSIGVFGVIYALSSLGYV